MKQTVVWWACLYSALTVTDVRAQSGAESKSNSSPSTEQFTKFAQPIRFPIQFQRTTLFFVQERVLSFSAEERARAISARIERLARDPQSDRTSVVANGEASSDIVCAPGHHGCHGSGLACPRALDRVSPCRVNAAQK